MKNTARQRREPDRKLIGGAILVLSIFFLSAFAATAVAAPTDFDGTYHLSCESGIYTLHFDLEGRVDDRPVSFHPADLQISVPCEADDPAIEEILATVEQQCLGAGLDTLCDSVVNTVESAINNTIGLVPLEVTTQITNADNWFAKLIRIYIMRVRHLFENGVVKYGYYLISDRNDSSNGDFAAFSFNVDDVIFGGIAGCATTMIAWVDGNIERDADFALAADYDIDRSLSCGFGYESDWLVGSIGLTFHADVTGTRAQP